MRGELLVVSSSERLDEQYGVGAAAQVMEALDLHQAAAASRGISVKRVLVESAEAARDAREALRSKVSASMVLLIGGDEIMPHFRIPNPVRDRSVDPDRWILSDNPYGTRNPAVDSAQYYMQQDVAVGRIVGSAGSLESLLKNIRNAAAHHLNGNRLDGAFAVVNREWSVAAEKVLTGFGANITYRESPGHRVTQSTLR